MIHRFAFFAASVAAAIALAVGLALAGFAPAGAPAGAVPVTATIAPQPQPTVQVDTVYLTPPASPQDVTVTKVVGRSGGEDGNEHEGVEND
jgi:hypothetical protein